MEPAIETAIENITLAPHESPALACMALHYPEKTYFLGQVFKDTTNSYKLVWFLAVLSLLKRGDGRTLRLSDVFTEMAIAAWHPVCLFRLSLGRQDKLQDVILKIQQLSGLRPNASPDAVRQFVKSLTFCEIYRNLGQPSC